MADKRPYYASFRQNYFYPRQAIKQQFHFNSLLTVTILIQCSSQQQTLYFENIFYNYDFLSTNVIFRI